MPTGVVAMTRAIALAETARPKVALTQLDTLARDLAGYRLVHASRATILWPMGHDLAEQLRWPLGAGSTQLG
jgi:predicted RNA polymerase sigma factor